MKKMLWTAALSVAFLAMSSASFAAGGPSGPKVAYQAQGHLGTVVVNPYKIAPLTAVIKNGGYTVENAKVRIVPKKGGVEIAYPVSNKRLLTHGGIPVFGSIPTTSTPWKSPMTAFTTGSAKPSPTPIRSTPRASTCR